MLQAFELEDVIKCRSLHEYTPPRLAAVGGAKQWPWTQTVWTYKCVAKPTATKVWGCVRLPVMGQWGIRWMCEDRQVASATSGIISH